MKKRSALILSAIVLLIASCNNKSGSKDLLVPKDAALVVHINSASLSSKLSWNEIKATTWFKKIQDRAKNEDSLAQRLLDDPDRSGINTKGDFVFYLRKHGRGGYAVVEGFLTDKVMYEQLLSEMNKKKPKEIKKDGEFSYMVAKETSVLVWNKSKFAIVSNSGFGEVMPHGFMKGANSSDDFKFESDSLRLFGEQALSLEGQNLENDSRYAELVKDGSDIHVWMNSGAYSSGLSILKKWAPMANTEELLKDNYTAMSINFDNGKISGKTKHYYNDQLSKIAANNKPENITPELLNRIPSTDVVAVMAFNFAPNGIKEVMSVLGVDVVADAFLSAKLNLSIDEIVKATKGQVLFAITDPRAKMDTMKMRNDNHVMPGMPTATFLLATSVKDKASFQKIVGVLEGLEKQAKAKMDNGDEGKGMGNMFKHLQVLKDINYKLSNDWFAITNSPDFTDKFLAGGNSNLPFASRISGHPTGAYIDLQRIIKFAGSMSTGMSKGGPINDMLSASLNMWQDVTVTGGEFKAKYSESQFEVNLVDKNTNSLKQFNQYIEKMSGAMNNRSSARVRDEEVPMPPPQVGGK